ncbi:hypothetical protein [Paraburkholderia unamae]|uniref:Uncharacterized protein n=2 Tax=Paraburkholderia TaxID=1822464 RepID=A0ACC6RTY2_9BURK
MVPNIAGAIAGSPKLINGLTAVFQQAHGGSFTEAQVQTLLLTNAVTNGSCVDDDELYRQRRQPAARGDVPAIRVAGLRTRR